MAKSQTGHVHKMRELEKLTELSRATINFYIREGILPFPEKSAKNMAYYDDNFIEKLLKVKELKKSGYSLSQIKQLMNSKQGSENELIIQALQNINRLLPSGEISSTVRRNDIIAEGFSDKEINEMIEMNLINPIDHEGLEFPAYNLTISKFVRYFLDFGIPLSVAKGVVEKLMDITHLESDAFFKYIREPLIHENASLEEQNAAIQNVIEKINTLLPMIHLQLLKLPVEKLYLLNNKLEKK